MPRKKILELTDEMLTKRPALQALRERFDGLEDIYLVIQAAEPHLSERAIHSLLDNKKKNGLEKILVGRLGRKFVAHPEKYATWLEKYRSS